MSTLLRDAALLDAERACRFILEQAEARGGRSAYQGHWPEPLSTDNALPAAVRTIARQRIRRVPFAVSRALLLWAEGAPVVLLTHVPAPDTVLRLQSRGGRCVSLLPPETSPAPHADALAFALHDLCHLDKFLDGEHHVGQVGFFHAVFSARKSDDWTSFQQQFDATLTDDWNHVISDMNGSAVFLFAAMKMKLKMAVRRHCQRALGAPPSVSGVLGPREQAAYDEAERALFRLLGLDGELESAARATSANRSDPAVALRLLRHFEAIGRDVVARASDRATPHIDRPRAVDAAACATAPESALQ